MSEVVCHLRNEWARPSPLAGNRVHVPERGDRTGSDMAAIARLTVVAVLLASAGPGAVSAADGPALPAPLKGILFVGFAGT